MVFVCSLFVVICLLLFLLLFFFCNALLSLLRDSIESLPFIVVICSPVGRLEWPFRVNSVLHRGLLLVQRSDLLTIHTSFHMNK